jgi:photosystem II stability/assembly factor-like uncharacterized protein
MLDARFAVDPAHPATAYLAEGSVYRGDGHIFETTDGGVTWTDISSTFPRILTEAIAIDTSHTPPTLYVGAGNGGFGQNSAVVNPTAGLGAGVYWSTDGGTTWVKSTGFPHVEVSDLRIDAVNHVLYAATYGRGVWSAPLS